MAQPTYFIPAAEVCFEEEIKKSRFITYLAHTPSIDQAKAFIHSIKTKHNDARHNCWAFVAASPKDSTYWGCSDDGEPAGTAGRPMLAQLSGSAVGEVTAVVARYFGGTKLGTGGLVKAYGGGVKHALTQLQTIEKIPQAQLTLICQYEQISLVEHLCMEHQAQIVNRNYTTQIELIVSIAERNAPVFTETLKNRSGGKIDVAAE